MIQAKLKQVIAEAPDDEKEAYQILLEESMNIAKAKDLDVLLAQLKGDTTDELLLAIENAEENRFEEEEDDGMPQIAELTPILETEPTTEESKSIIHQNDDTTAGTSMLKNEASVTADSFLTPAGPDGSTTT